MGSVFKRIRKSILKSKNPSKDYFKYAFGEIVLLMVGVLLALQVNNWKEERKNQKIAKEIYREFSIALVKDSIDLARISKIFNTSFNAQNYFIKNSATTVLQEKSLSEIKDLILKTLDVSHSFFPRYGIYEQTLNNGQFVMLKSDTIRNQLMEVYERRYKLYEHVDATVEKKIHFDLQPVVKGKYQLFSEASGIITPNTFTPKIFTEHYNDFTFQLRSMNSILGSTKNIIEIMGSNIHLTLDLLREEIGKEK